MSIENIQEAISKVQANIVQWTSVPLAIQPLKLIEEAYKCIRELRNREERLLAPSKISSPVYNLLKII